MALLHWSDKYDVGVASIDTQHRELADLVNALEGAVASGATVHRALDRLMRFTDRHFDHEQALFRQTGYPAADLHIKRHGFLALILKRFGETVDNSQGLPESDLVFLRGWLLDHIGKDDRAFADYMRGQRS